LGESEHEETLAIGVQRTRRRSGLHPRLESGAGGSSRRIASAGAGPGQSNIYMRGLSVGPGTINHAGAVGDFPNVAVYLDDQSAQLPGRNLDIYAADLERIEALEGPQGTLFGAGAEAGVLRYITNKPKLNFTEGAVNAGYATTAHGDPSSNADANINLPLIEDTLAIRAVIYIDSRGGYINNVPGTFVRQSTDGGIHYTGYTNNIPGPAASIAVRTIARCWISSRRSRSPPILW
jgi:outer membrane receptor protein involved in Fe transport